MLSLITSNDCAFHLSNYCAVMKRDALLMRGDGPVIFSQVKHDVNVDQIVSHIEKAYLARDKKTK